VTWLVSVPARFWEPLCLAVGLHVAHNRPLFPDEAEALLGGTKAAWVVHENRESFWLFTIEDDTQLRLFVGSLARGRDEVEVTGPPLGAPREIGLHGWWGTSIRRAEAALNVCVIDRLASLGSATLTRINL